MSSAEKKENLNLTLLSLSFRPLTTTAGKINGAPPLRFDRALVLLCARRVDVVASMLFRSSLEGVGDGKAATATGETAAAPLSLSVRKVNVILFFASSFHSIEASVALDCDHCKVS